MEKSLFNRLSDPHKKVLEDLEYKSTSERLVSILKKEPLFTKLELGVCMELYFILVPAKPFDLTTFENLFYL